MFLFLLFSILFSFFSFDKNTKHLGSLSLFFSFTRTKIASHFAPRQSPTRAIRQPLAAIASSSSAQSNPATTSSASSSTTTSNANAKRPRVPRPLSNSHHPHHHHHNNRNSSKENRPGLSITTATSINATDAQPSRNRDKSIDSERKRATGAADGIGAHALSSSSPRSEGEIQPNVSRVENTTPVVLSTIPLRSSKTNSNNKNDANAETDEDKDECLLISSVTIKCLDEDIDDDNETDSEHRDSQKKGSVSPAITVTTSNTPPLTSSRKKLNSLKPEISDSTNSLLPPTISTSARERRHTDNEVSFVEKLRQQAEKEVVKTQFHQQHVQAVSSSAGSSANSGSSAGETKVERR
jgi:hypothetical protein